jgi:hypothetical protein
LEARLEVAAQYLEHRAVIRQDKGVETHI